MGHHYELSGVHLESDFPFTSLPGEPSLASAPELRVRIVEAASPALLSEAACLLERKTDGVPWLSIGRCPGGYLFKVHGFADFTLDTQRAELTCAPLDGCEADVLEQLFIDQIFPLVLHVSGRFSFHASSVASVDAGAGGVLAFLGAGGLGKSTLASSLARTAAFTLFSDDCLALTPTASDVVVHPSYPSSRLWPPSAEALFRDQGELPFVSSRTEKRRAALSGERAPRSLDRVYLLEQGDGSPTITRLRRRDALAALAAHLYRLDFEDRVRLTEELSLLERVVTSAVVARLSYRRDYAELPAVHALIRADAVEAA